ncbi:amidohydrolase family protein [Fredinandcohnia humi]
MRNKYVRYVFLIALFLFIGLFGTKFYSPSESTIEKEELVKNQLVINGLNLKGITFYEDKVLALLEEDNKTTLFIGDNNGSAIDNIKQWDDFQLPSNETKEYEGIEINADAHLLYLYGMKDDGTNFFDTINIATKQVVDSITIEDNAILSNIKYKNGYMEGMLYAKTNQAKQKGEIIINTPSFDSHMDLLVVELPSKDSYIDWIDSTSDLEYIVYSLKDNENKKISTFVHNLATNQTSEVKDIKGSKNLLFNGDSLLGFRGNKDTLDVIEYKYKNSIEASTEKQETNYDIVIKNGMVIDPAEETIKVGYHVGITNDRVAIITKTDITGDKVINAFQKIVSPGFIDMLSFNPNLMAAQYKIGDGVTTNLSMHGSTVDFDGLFAHYEKFPTLVNYGGALFAVRLRYEAGLGNHGAPTPEQIEYMANRAREEIKKGALAVAFSPEYYPGTTPEEIKAIMKVAKEYGIVSHFHGRHSSLTGEFTSIDSVKEVLGYARELDAPVHFMHLHSTGGTGAMDEALQLIEEARADGYQVTYDVYPYDSWATDISFERLSGDWQSRFGITYSDIQVAGTTERLTEETFPIYRKKGGQVIVYAMNEEELIQALEVDHSMIGSDATMDSEFNHPRGAGTFSRYIGRYIRDKDVQPLMEGLKKVTIHAARQLEGIAPAMKTRGRLQEGSHADITVFDYNQIIDTSTPEKPATYPKGIEYVLVSGKIVKDETGVLTKIKNGRPIKGIFK